MGINRTIDITSEQRKTLLALLAKHLPDTTAWVYGSRVQWTARPQSDLDMLVFASPSQNDRVSALREALEESNLPFLVDLFVWDNVPDQFRKHIEAEHVVLVEKEQCTGSDCFQTVGEFSPFSYGKGLPDHKRHPSGQVPVFGSNGIVGYHDISLTNSPTVIVGRKGTIGAVHYSPVPCWPIDTTFFVTDRDSEILRFKYYALKSLSFNRMNVDSAVPGLNRDTAHACNLRVPAKLEQRAIAHILGTLDDKIELNRRMNETLEAMAQALFKSWFVDFDPVHAKATLKRHDPHHSLPQQDSAKAQANDTSRTGITPPSKAQANDPSHSGITPPSKSRINDPSRSRITPPLRGSRQDKGEARRRIATTSITPPLRGSRQDKGASPPSSRWGVIKRQYSQQTLQNAKVLRQNQTNAEGLLWHYLRNKQMDGHKFRRQQPIGPYIVDFACMPRKLIVELDGGQHAKQEAYDEKRDTFLQDKGYRILRFWNNEVFENCFGVLESIYNALHHHPPLEGGSKDASLSERGSPPPHQPSPAGSVSATPPRGGSDFHGEAMKDEFRGNTPQGGSEWTPERAHAYLDSMDDDIMALFPDSFEDSELGKIPKGWEVKTLGEVVDIVGGTTPSTKIVKYWENGTHYWATPKDLSSLSVPVLLETERKISDAGLQKIGSGLLPPGTLLLSSRAPIGYLAITQVPVAINQGFIAMLPNEGFSNQFLLNWCEAFLYEIVNHANGSTFLEISKSNFREIELISPNALVLNLYHRLVSELRDRIVVNEHTSRSLATLRDILLPKLISGKVRVTAGDKITENTI